MNRTEPDIRRIRVLQEAATPEAHALALQALGLDVVRRESFAEPGEGDFDATLMIVDRLDSALPKCRRALPQLSEPVVLLYGAGSEVDRVLLYELGADDVAPSDLSTRELVARLRAIRRRAAFAAAPSRPQADSESGWELAPERRMLWSPCREAIALTHAEAQFIGVLAAARDRVLSRAKAEEIFGRGGANSRSIDILVSRLRQKISRVNKDFIRTIRGVGYSVTEPIVVRKAPA